MSSNEGATRATNSATWREPVALFFVVSAIYAFHFGDKDHAPLLATISLTYAILETGYRMRG